MTGAWSTNPWVAAHQEQIGVALQVFPLETPSEPARHLLAAGQLAEALWFDAFLLGDHPAWGLDCWLHLGALAVTTRRIRLGPNVACAWSRSRAGSSSPRARAASPRPWMAVARPPRSPSCW